MLATHPAATPDESVRKCAVRHPPVTLEVIAGPLTGFAGPPILKRGMPLVSAVQVEEGVPEKIFKRSPPSLRFIELNEIVTYCPGTTGQNFTSPLTLFE